MFVSPKKSQLFVLIVLITLSACGKAIAPTAEAAQPSISSPRSTQPPTETSPVTSLATATANPTVEATESVQVIFTAAKGALNIRRGPNLSYNPIAVLAPNQSATVKGRDLLGDWAMIDIPSAPGKTGWVSLQTPYSQIKGDIFNLPEVWVDFATPAYIRNCTLHNMTLQPTGEQLFGALSFPDNQLRVEPGSYRVYDDDSAEYAEVLSVSIVEGNIIDITVDGDQNKHKCN